jgi:RNA polymerase sigma factor (sigma-70 family)
MSGSEIHTLKADRFDASGGCESVMRSVRLHVMGVLRRRGVGLHEAEDIVQETLGQVWARWDELRDRRRLLSWATSIALNRLRSERGRARHFEEVPADVPVRQPDPLESLLRKEAHAWLSLRLDTLRPELRLALRLRVGEATSPEVVASRLGVSRHRLRRLLYQSMRSLRRGDTREGQAWVAALGIAG